MATHQTFERRSRIEAPASEVFAWHLRAGAFERLVPPGDTTRVAERSGRIEDDTMRVVLDVPVLGPIRQRWSIRHEGFIEHRRFVDVMERGPFKAWRHEHLVEPDGFDACELVDHVEYRLPMGGLGRMLGTPIVRRKLTPMFEHRHAITVGDLAAHRAAALDPLLIDLRGAGEHPLGVQLAAFLLTGGHEVAGDVTIVGAELPAAHASADAVVTLDGDEARVIVGTADTLVLLDGDPVDGPRRVLAAIAAAR